MTNCHRSRLLAAYLRRLINANGPLTVARYMSEALNNPSFGYYTTRDPLGTRGDFTTAPEISQMFGELIGAWFIDCWRGLGAPDPVLLVELGPGRGTLISDLWRGIAVSPDFRAAVRFCLVEASPVLRSQQQQRLSNLRPLPALDWYSRLADVPDGILLLIGNEFFDTLPVHQFVDGADGWRERLIDRDLCQADAFRYVLSHGRTPATAWLDSGNKSADAMEVCPSGLSLAHDIAERVTRVGGAALIVDFVANYLDFSLQAVRGHDHHDPLMSPGSADLACAVNFAALSKVARTAGALVHGPRGQGAFLESLGISSRAERLAQGVSAETSQMIHSGRRRLTEPGFMGELFQAMAITSGSLVSVAGFEPT